MNPTPETVTCLDCGTDHEAGKECPICAPLLRALNFARERRRDYGRRKAQQPPQETRNPHAD